jgi:hypothetical protein
MLRGKGLPLHSRIYILWRTDPLLDNDREINNETTAVARQHPARNNGRTFGGGAFYVVRSEAISCDRPSSNKPASYKIMRMNMFAV